MSTRGDDGRKETTSWPDGWGPGAVREREEADLRLVGLLLGCSGLRARGGIDGLGPIRLGGSGWLVFLFFF